jgi:hypothetical protein
VGDFSPTPAVRLLVEVVDLPGAAMLTLMPEPAFNDERLEHAARFHSILQSFPTDRPIT